MKVSVPLTAWWLTLASAALAAPYPLSVTDDLGVTVTLEREPERVVAMMPSHTETLCALDACDKLVGVDDFTNYPPETDDLPRLGGAFSPNIEAILALEPDLVLADESSDLAAALRNAGVTVYAGTAQTFDEAFEKFAVLGQLVNRELEAALLVERVRGEIEAIAAQTEALEGVSVYYEIDPTPFSVGPGSFIGVLLAKAGGENIVTEDLGDFPQLDPEYVIAADPEVIIVSEEDAGALPERPGWAGISAVQQGRVVTTDAVTRDAISRPGPRMVEAVRFFARALHPEVFGEPEAVRGAASR
ncbi:ABC transporter substrate-binding protein [Truepera radiovictrix]|uniref:Periplasmic binding protein n=1 Tax=Truepera radiovictrix (strain DSM 17093 / CIP 108686 / LMG 22925 / RQ-24) TaxID=649638 RepID=D7CRN2_TRURR|nr:ABC transporter substrate-binding protein [Truepera radiovictrix]ADI13522.1 periplasmic binding protein [Truepera radiovictrix DSM 17093]WMT57916.1 ABC transporter substrate-binding protein [Truepera radiovictrix]